MNTYYLKKFRKEAYKLYGMIWYEESSECNVWNVGKRKELVPRYTFLLWRYYSEEDAIKALENLRRGYILSKTIGIRYDRKLRKINKQLAKL